MSAQKVYTLLVTASRFDDDNLPDDAVGAALLCYASGVDEAEAVRETVAILKQAELQPLEVTSYGTLPEREAEGFEPTDRDLELMKQALDENSVIVVEILPLTAEDMQGDAE